MWTMCRDGFVGNPKFKLQGRSLAQAPMTQAPFAVSVLIKFNQRVKQLLSYYLKNFVIANSVSIPLR